MPAPTEMSKPVFNGCLLVLTITKPPVKSAGYSGAGLLTITILSIWLLGMMSNEKARESASELGTALPLSHTLLYRCDKPLTITNLSSIIEMPGTLLITSEASLSCVLAICCDETPVCTTLLFFSSSIMAASVSLRATATTVTSDNEVTSGIIGMSSISSSIPKGT